MTRKHRTVVQNRFSSFFGPLGALWSPRLTSQRSKVADGTCLGAALRLQSGTRGCRRAALALESPARKRPGTINGAQSVNEACSRAPKTNKRTARAFITAACPRKPSLARRLRAWTAPRTLSRICCRSHLWMLSSFFHLCFFGVSLVFVLSLVLLPSLVFTFFFDWWDSVVLVLPTLSETSIRKNVLE